MSCEFSSLAAHPFARGGGSFVFFPCGSAVLTCAPCSDKPSPMADFPMREWSLRLYLLDEDGNEHTADVFTKVVYNLHPTFENPVQSKS